MKNRSGPKHIVFAGGSTAGHLFPGLAVAEQLVEMVPELSITFVGCGKPLEQRAVTGAGFRYVTIASHPLPARATEALRFLRLNLAGSREATALLRDRPASAVVGLGGYASAAMARVAVRRGIPLVLLEQNAMPGRVTRWLAPSAQLICTAFDAARRHLKASCPIRCVGNPLRKGFGRPPAASLAASPLSDRTRRLLVLGGSQGSAALNDLVPKALHTLRDRLQGWKIVHQSGEAHWLSTKRLYDKLAITAQVAPFFENLPELMHKSQLAVSRAGGTTLAELAAAGLPAVLVPYPHAADDHQRHNAEHFHAAGACRLFDQREKNASHLELAAQISPLLADESCRAQASASMLSLARVQAAWHVATMVLELAQLGSNQRHRALRRQGSGDRAASTLSLSME
jgi:UDP-N-acetylglucosamine--N-acetylmuramyl-(pentapeptide) pyrophosphoryl-undecaprenol N-acetylglucosamine transferase